MEIIIGDQSEMSSKLASTLQFSRVFIFTSLPDFSAELILYGGPIFA